MSILKRRFFVKNQIKKPVFYIFPHDKFCTWRSPCGHPKVAKLSPKEGAKKLTDKQRDEIRKMRFNGLGYKMIAKLIGSKENNVYEYCKAHGLSGTPELVRLNHSIWCEQNNRCAFCGRKLQQPRVGRRRRFCSGSCRTRYCIMRKEMEESKCL